jgi:hypothetical protein
MGVSTSTATDPAEVAAYFDRLRTEPKDTQVRGLSGTCRFDIESVGSWLLIVNDGHVEARQGGGPADMSSAAPPMHFSLWCAMDRTDLPRRCEAGCAFRAISP